MLESSWHAELRSFIVRLLSRQSLLKKLPEHGYQIFLAFLLFTATSWVTYYFIAPSLVRYSKKKKARSDEQARLKWGHMAVSFLHAVIVSAWSLYLWYDNSLAHSMESRVFGYSRDFGLMFSFSVGYFLWDVFCCAWYLKHYGKGFFVHSLLGLLSLSCCYRPFMMYPSSRFLLFEVSTIFVDMHWFLEKLGYGGSLALMFNDACGLLAYLGVRLIFGSYLTFRFMKDLWLVPSSVPLFFVCVSFLANVTTHVLNFYWFYKLCRSALRTLRQQPSSSTAATAAAEAKKHS